MPPIEFNAPWSRSLRIGTAIFIAIFCVLILLGFSRLLGEVPRLIMILLPSVILVTSLAAAIRGYVLTEHEIEIRRLGWTTRLPLDTLQSVEGKADALNNSVRLFANGGLFSFTGWFWNRQLKLFRAYATDPSRSVVLRYPNKTIVITPHDPQQFIVRARTFLRAAQFPH